MQVTAGALTGLFGPRAKYWGEKFLGDGLTHILATDAHSSGRRVPVLSQARDIAEKLLGAQEATQLVSGRPNCILSNVLPSQAAPLPSAGRPVQGPSWLQRVLRRAA